MAVLGCYEKAAQNDVHYGSGVSIGYLAIHTFGLLMGTLLLPPSPSAFRRLQKQIQKNSSPPVPKLDGGAAFGEEEKRQPSKAAIELFSYAVSWWTLLGVLALCLPLTTTSPFSSARPDISMIQHQSTISRRLVRLLLSLILIGSCLILFSIPLRQICLTCFGWRLTTRASFWAI